MKKNKIKPALKYSSNVEKKLRYLLSMMINSPMSKQDLFSNLGLFKQGPTCLNFYF